MVEDFSIKDHEEQGFPLRAARCWNRSRLELREALRRIEPYLAELYEGSVLLLCDFQIPGRVRMIAHAVREIGNALPEKICGTSFPRRFDPTGLLDDLAAQWKRCGFDTNSHDLASYGEQPEALPRRPTVEIHASLLRKISHLLQKFSESRQTNKAKAAELFKACDRQNESQLECLMPVLAQWLEVIEWFVGLAHDRKRCDEEIGQQPFTAQFELFEVGMRALITDFFGTVSEELDEILERANS